MHFYLPPPLGEVARRSRDGEGLCQYRGPLLFMRYSARDEFAGGLLKKAGGLI